jgi:hypothetical protein
MDNSPATIKGISDREIRLGNSRMALCEDGILHISARGGPDACAAAAMIAAAQKLIQNMSGKKMLCIDLNEAGPPSSGARKIFQNNLESQEIHKIAFFGLSPVARIIASFLIGVSKKKTLRFLKKKEDALDWLRE